MVILEQAVGMPREGVVPSAAIPRPVDIFCGKLIADVGNGLAEEPMSSGS